MKDEVFKCTQCGETKPVNKAGGTGYGVDKDENKICYSCIGKNEETELSNAKPGDKFILYLCGDEVTNWPGSFKRTIRGLRTGRHNMAGKRYDFYFTVNNNDFHGVQYGDNTQIAHCKRIK